MNAAIADAIATEIQGPAADSRATSRPSKRRALASIWEAVRIAVDCICSHKLRSFLTLLGIIIGVASVVTVGGAIEGLGYYVKDRLSSTFGSNSFILARIAGMNISAEEYEKRNRRNKRIYVDDLRAIRERCDGCEAISPVMQTRTDVKAGGSTFYEATLQGVGADITKIQQLELTDGRFLSLYDAERARPVAIIGADIRKELFGPLDPMGKEIRLNGEPYTVIGLEKPSGSFFGQSMDSNIYIPYTSFLNMYGARRSLTVRVKVPSEGQIENTQDEVRMIMRSRHKLRPNQEDDFDILDSKSMQQSVNQFTGAIAMVVTPITLISLVVGGIVVMNIMLVSVTERTNEIGLRKALGAKRSDILMQFLIESSLLAACGGVFGLLLAYGLALIIRASTPIPMTITLAYILLALLVSGGIGMISGIYPAYRAARLDPIVALSRD